MIEPDIKIPPAFWKTITNEDMKGIVEHGGLNAEQCARLWRMTDRQGPPPLKIQTFVRRADVERLWPMPKTKR